MSKTKLSWTNPTVNTDGTPYDQKTQGEGYELAIAPEGAMKEPPPDPVVTLPFKFGNTFDMKDLDAYKALKSGTYAALLRVVTREGERSAYAEAFFLKAGTPAAPAALAVA